MALVLVLAADLALARESAEGAIQGSPGHRPGYLVLPVLKGLKARPYSLAVSTHYGLTSNPSAPAT